METNNDICCSDIGTKTEMLSAELILTRPKKKRQENYPPPCKVVNAASPTLYIPQIKVKTNNDICSCDSGTKTEMLSAEETIRSPKKKKKMKHPTSCSVNSVDAVSSPMKKHKVRQELPHNSEQVRRIAIVSATLHQSSWCGI